MVPIDKSIVKLAFLKVVFVYYFHMERIKSNIENHQCPKLVVTLQKNRP